MKPVAEYSSTPIGIFKFPLNSAFLELLDKCETDEDLFKLVEPNGFIDPDAFTELDARGLVSEYEIWKKRKNNN